MRQGIATGLAISALVHAGVFFGGILIPHAPAAKPAPAPKLPPNVIEVAPLPPDDTPPPEDTTAPVHPQDFAPPMQRDVPTLARPTDIIQRVEPPPPDHVSPGQFTIPQGQRDHPWGQPPILNPEDLDQQPIARVQSPPQYPFEMRRTGSTGTVFVDFIVDANGDVRNAYAARSTQREFEDAAVRAVSKWKFKPGLKAGHAVNTHMQVPIVFSLDAN